MSNIEEWRNYTFGHFLCELARLVTLSNVCTQTPSLIIHFQKCHERVALK